MKCPKCSSSMTCLFISWVCDICNPPGTSTNKPNDKPKDGLHYGFIVMENSYGFMDILKTGGTVSKFVYKTKEEAEGSWIALNMVQPIPYKVVSRVEIDYAEKNSRNAARIKLIDKNFWSKNKDVAKGYIALVD